MRVGPAGTRERYELLEQLGDDSESLWSPAEAPSVWRARDTLKERFVAIKIVRRNSKHPEPIEEGEGWKLWRMAGHAEAQREPAPVINYGYPGQAHCAFAWATSFFRLMSSSHHPSTALKLRRSSFADSVLYQMDDLYYHAPGNLATATPEQRLLGTQADQFGEAAPADIWAVGVVISQLLFDKNLARDGIDQSLYSSGFPLLEQWHVRPAEVVNLASLHPEAGWPAFFDTAKSADYPADTSAYSDFPFYLPAITPLPSIRERILAEPAATSFSPSEVDLLTSFLRACWTLNPYKRPLAKDLLEDEFVRDVEV
ncbi:hypothetical protein JCM6882_006036 [Rhodosporidiobolus microsporus]